MAELPAVSTVTTSPPAMEIDNESNKRAKTSTPEEALTEAVNIEYPENIPKPSRGLVQKCYEEAIQADDGDQSYLADAGILSLEQVLLPAVAFQELSALKKLQKRVQRDYPQHKHDIEATRKAVIKSLKAASDAVKTSRAERKVQEEAREKEWKLEEERRELQRKEQQEQLAQKKAQEREARKQQRKRELQKKLPANQELWREVAYLMTELDKLKMEEIQWKKTSEQLKKEEEYFVEKAAKQQEQPKENVQNQAPIKELATISETATDIALSAKRIEQALQIVSKTVEQADASRKALYEQYTADHQFRGYQGANDPKGLLQTLSQSQDDW